VKVWFYASGAAKHGQRADNVEFIDTIKRDYHKPY
jgi:hypothetical protein